MEIAEIFIDPGSPEVKLKEEIAEKIVENEFKQLEELIGWKDVTDISPGQFPSIEKIIGDDIRFPEIEKIINEYKPSFIF